MNNFWNETIWKGINDEVRKVAGTIRVAQKVFPTTILDNPSSIPDDTIDLATFSIPEGLTKAFVEIAVPFSLTPNQVAYEATLQTGLKLAKLDAAVLAFIEDLIVFQGINATLPQTPANIVVKNQGSADTGLLGLASDNPPIAPIPVDLLNPLKPGYGANTLNAVVLGIGRLNGNSQPGPFALILDYRVVSDVYSILGPSLTTVADLITPLVTGGLFGTAALPPWTGLLVSLGGEPTTIYVGIEATTAFTFMDQQDNYSFRVFERVQFGARDPRAFVRLDFAAPKPIISKIEPATGKPGGGGGDTITITGQYLAGVSAVYFGTVLAAKPYKYVDDGCIKVVSPNQAAGIVDITVTTTKGSTSDITASDKFTYP